jgi:predicted ester cyclase
MMLANVYRDYIACLNRQDWPSLGRHVHDDVEHNGRRLGLSGYREMLEEDFRQIPNLTFHIDLLICEPPRIASRLLFDCTPKGRFLDLDVDGRRIAFAENVFYVFQDFRIRDVWSIIDKGAIELQLRSDQA